MRRRTSINRNASPPWPGRQYCTTTIFVVRTDNRNCSRPPLPGGSRTARRRLRRDHRLGRLGALPQVRQGQPSGLPGPSASPVPRDARDGARRFGAAAAGGQGDPQARLRSARPSRRRSLEPSTAPTREGGTGKGRRAAPCRSLPRSGEPAAGEAPRSTAAGPLPVSGAAGAGRDELAGGDGAAIRRDQPQRVSVESVVVAFRGPACAMAERYIAGCRASWRAI